MTTYSTVKENKQMLFYAKKLNKCFYMQKTLQKASTLHAKDFNKNCFYSTCKKSLTIKCIYMQKNFNKTTA